VMLTSKPKKGGSFTSSAISNCCKGDAIFQVLIKLRAFDTIDLLCRQRGLFIIFFEAAIKVHEPSCHTDN
jgi:hypothetical protein